VCRVRSFYVITDQILDLAEFALSGALSAIVYYTILNKVLLVCENADAAALD